MNELVEYVKTHSTEAAVVITALVIFLLRNLLLALGRGLLALLRCVAGHLSKRLAVCRFEGQYRNAVIEDNRYVRLRGVRTQAGVGTALDDVYVDLKLKRAERRPVPPLEQTSAEMGDREAREEREQTLALPAALRAHNRLVVLGGPGSGKSTLVQHLTLRFARREATERLNLQEQRLPIVVQLREVRQNPQEAQQADLPSHFPNSCRRGALGGASSPLRASSGAAWSAESAWCSWTAWTKLRTSESACVLPNGSSARLYHSPRTDMLRRHAR